MHVPVPLQPVSARGFGRYRRERERDRELQRGRESTEGDEDADAYSYGDLDRTKTPTKVPPYDAIELDYAYPPTGLDGQLGGYVRSGQERRRGGHDDLMAHIEAGNALEASLGLGAPRSPSPSTVVLNSGTGTGWKSGADRPTSRGGSANRAGTDGEGMRVRVEKALQVTAVPRSSVSPHNPPHGPGKGRKGDSFMMSIISPQSAPSLDTRLDTGAGSGARASSPPPPSPVRSDAGSLFVPYPYSSPPNAGSGSALSALEPLKRGNSTSSASVTSARRKQSKDNWHPQTASAGSVGLASVPERGESAEKNS